MTDSLHLSYRRDPSVERGRFLFTGKPSATGMNPDGEAVIDGGVTYVNDGEYLWRVDTSTGEGYAFDITRERRNFFMLLSDATIKVRGYFRDGKFVRAHSRHIEWDFPRIDPNTGIEATNPPSRETPDKSWKSFIEHQLENVHPDVEAAWPVNPLYEVYNVENPESDSFAKNEADTGFALDQLRATAARRFAERMTDESGIATDPEVRSALDFYRSSGKMDFRVLDPEATSLAHYSNFIDEGSALQRAEMKAIIGPEDTAAARASEREILKNRIASDKDCLERIAEELIFHWQIGSAYDAVLQYSAQKEFWINDDWKFGADDEGMSKDVKSRITDNEDSPHMLAIYRAFIDDQYRETQIALKDAGIKSINVHRGMRSISDETLNAPDFGDAGVVMRPMSSWTTNKKHAKMFARDNYTISSEIPASRIIATPVTGFGCITEDEVVVLGGPVMRVRIEFGDEARRSPMHFSQQIRVRGYWRDGKYIRGYVRRGNLKVSSPDLGTSVLDSIPKVSSLDKIDYVSDYWKFKDQMMKELVLKGPAKSVSSVSIYGSNANKHNVMVATDTLTRLYSAIPIDNMEDVSWFFPPEDALDGGVHFRAVTEDGVGQLFSGSLGSTTFGEPRFLGDRPGVYALEILVGTEGTNDLEETLNSAASRGWLGSPSISGTVTHEYGHMLDAATSGSLTAWCADKFWAGTAQGSMAKKYWHWNTDSDVTSDAVEQADLDRAELESVISSYAVTNPAECAAELFAYIMTHPKAEDDPQHEWLGEFREWLPQMLNRNQIDHPFSKGINFSTQQIHVKGYYRDGKFVKPYMRVQMVNPGDWLPAVVPSKAEVESHPSWRPGRLDDNDHFTKIEQVWQWPADVATLPGWVNIDEIDNVEDPYYEEILGIVKRHRRSQFKVPPHGNIDAAVKDDIAKRITERILKGPRGDKVVDAIRSMRDKNTWPGWTEGSTGTIRSFVPDELYEATRVRMTPAQYEEFQSSLNSKAPDEFSAAKLIQSALSVGTEENISAFKQRARRRRDILERFVQDREFSIDPSVPRTLEDTKQEISDLADLLDVAGVGVPNYIAMNLYGGGRLPQTQGTTRDWLRVQTLQRPLDSNSELFDLIHFNPDAISDPADMSDAIRSHVEMLSHVGEPGLPKNWSELMLTGYELEASLIKVNAQRPTGDRVIAENSGEGSATPLKAMLADIAYSEDFIGNEEYPLTPEANAMLKPDDKRIWPVTRSAMDIQSKWLQDNYEELLAAGPYSEDSQVLEMLVSGVMGSWATTSNDSNRRAWLTQRLAEIEFNFTDSAYWMTPESLYSAKELTGEISSNNDQENTKNRATILRAILRAQYDETQSLLSDAGIESLNLARGLSAYSPDGEYDFQVPELPEFADSNRPAEAISGFRPGQLVWIDDFSTNERKHNRYAVGAWSGEVVDVSEANGTAHIKWNNSSQYSPPVEVGISLMGLKAYVGMQVQEILRHPADIYPGLYIGLRPDLGDQMPDWTEWQDVYDKVSLPIVVPSSISAIPFSITMRDPRPNEFPSYVRDDWGNGETSDVSMAPLSSWSTSAHTAAQFALGDGEYESPGAMLVSTVPAERIFSTSLTGLGCLNEHEVVVFGGPNMSATVWKQQADEYESDY